MKKLTAEHAFAIARAESSVHPRLIPNMSPHLRKSIEDDLVLLSEVKYFILQSIYESVSLFGSKRSNEDLQKLNNLFPKERLDGDNHSTS